MMCISLCTYVCVPVYVRTCVHAYVRTYVCMCMYVCTYICMYAIMFMYVRTYVRMLEYTYSFGWDSLFKLERPLAYGATIKAPSECIVQKETLKQLQLVEKVNRINYNDSIQLQSN